MKRFALLLLLPLLLSACQKTYEFHIRRTVTVDTPQGEVRASTVSKVKYFHSYGSLVLPDARGFGGGVAQGEATVVDLGNGRYLFVLIGNDTAQLREAHRAAYDAARKGNDNWVPYWMAALKQQTTPRPVPPKFYPLLVTFGDVSDPASVMRVDPADLAATFGAGYALREITLEVTDEPVTEGVVEGVLDYFWWPKEKWHDYACSKYGCGDNPVRLVLPDGRYTSLVKSDFLAEKRK